MKNKVIFLLAILFGFTCTFSFASIVNNKEEAVYVDHSQDHLKQRVYTPAEIEREKKEEQQRKERNRRLAQQEAEAARLYPGELSHAQGVSISVKSGTAYTDGDYSGDFRIRGELYNSGSTSVVYVKITINAYDSGNNLLDTGFTFMDGGTAAKSGDSFYEALSGGGTGFFEKSLNTPYAGVDHYSTTITYSNYSHTTCKAGLKFKNSPSVSNSYGDVKFLGEIENPSSYYTTYYTQVYFAVYNSGGKVIDVAFTFVDGITYQGTDTSIAPNSSAPYSKTTDAAYSSYSSYKSSIIWREKQTNTPPGITVKSPNGGESWNASSAQTITWSTAGSVSNVKIEYSTNGGSSWNTITSSTSNDGSHSWTLPNTSSSTCKVRVSDASDSNVYDTSNSNFSIVIPAGNTLSLTSPNGGESWEVGEKQWIEWSSTGTVGNVKLEYSTNGGSSWTTISSSTSNDGLYWWTVPNAVSSNCKVKVSEASDGSPSDTSNSVFSITAPSTPPEISVSRTDLYFCYIVGGAMPKPQTFAISNSGGGVLNWSIADGSDLSCSPDSGANSAFVTVTLDPTGLSAGYYYGELPISASGASNSPQTVTAWLEVKSASENREPFGQFATPSDGANVSSSIAVTGWVLDDNDIESVKIYRENGPALAYIGDAVFVEGSRPDVDAAYPGYPRGYLAGWGYMLLTNFMPNGGNGTFTLHAVATDTNGKSTDLGSKTITIDNKNAVKPFGAIDTPTQGGTASGGKFVNWGWVLTPQPKSIPTDGSTIKVFVDGVYLGNPNYNVYRSDIATLFPGYANTDGAIGYFFLDTTAYENGVHAIQWTARDSGGAGDGIGSRYFTINNSGGSRVKTDTGAGILLKPYSGSTAQHTASSRPIGVKEGLVLNALDNHPGMEKKTVKEVDRVVIDVNGLWPMSPGTLNEKTYSGFLYVDGRLLPMPIGSTLNSLEGMFYWSAGPAFMGQYHLVFARAEADGSISTRSVLVDIQPKFDMEQKENIREDISR
jgi:hypothetical protein